VSSVAEERSEAAECRRCTEWFIRKIAVTERKNEIMFNQMSLR